MISEELAQLLEPRAPDRAAWCSFDAAWYLRAYSVARAALGPAAEAEAVRVYYVTQGRALGHAPNMFVDEAWYLARYPDAAAAVQAGEFGSGYEHYCAIGYLNRSPHWLYDEALYIAQSPDLTDERLLEAECVNLYDHYLKAGAREGRSAHLLFQPEYYLASLADPQEAETLGPFEAYLDRAWRDRVDADTSPYFDAAWFLRRYPDLRGAIEAGRWCNALHAYLAQAEGGLDPNAYFAERRYVDSHADAQRAVTSGEMASGYEHFLKVGVFALRSPSEDIDLAAFSDRRPGLLADIAAGRERDAFSAFLRAPTDIQLLALPAAFAIPAPVASPPPEPEPAPPPPPPPAPLAAPEPTPVAPPVAPPVVPPAAPESGHGHVEYYGHQRAAHGWFFAGWISPAPAQAEAEVAFTARFALGQLTGTALLATLPREDVAGFGCGIVLFAAEPGPPLGRLVALTLTTRAPADAGFAWTITPTDGVQHYSDSVLSANVLPTIAQLAAPQARQRLTALAERRGFTGVNTLGELRQPVFLEIDEAILCGRHGIALIGWAIWEPGTVRRVCLQSGHITTEIDLAEAIRLERPDVRDSVGLKYGLTDVACGFIAFLPHAISADAPPYLEVETTTGAFGYRGLPAPKLRGMEAIRFLLDRIDLRYDAVGRAFDRVLGPAVAALNNDRLRTPVGHTEIVFGQPPARPALSVIVALYGRLDFMEYQLAFASRHTPAIAVEYLYVLDDPTKKREAETLAASLWQRFAIPLRLIELDRNVGFAPTNNVGLDLAQGEFICFLNSDVFAGTDDWMERMLARLHADPQLGAVGPLLLFEDDCVQHQGMTYERLPLFANWHFPMHPRKGWRPPAQTGLLHATAITGACMVMRRSIAQEFGGFDESYIIGDFEDSDLCLKLRDRGLACAVDLDARLYHLERQSQLSPENRWRMNLTLYNAWVHERRWSDTLARLEPTGDST